MLRSSSKANGKFELEKMAVNEQTVFSSNIQDSHGSHDPKGINSNLLVNFDDVFGEPPGIESVGCFWSLSHDAFEFTKTVV